jgi:hypothetical protein
MQEASTEKVMSDEEATPFHWWLLQYLKEQLFEDNPEQLRPKPIEATNSKQAI